MRISCIFLIMMFSMINSQEYEQYEEYFIRLNLVKTQPNYNLNEPTKILCDDNMICRKIIAFIYYWFCVYIVTIIIRSIIVICVLILCLIND